MTMRFRLVVALGVLAHVACGSSTNSGPTGKAGSSGSAGQGGAAGSLGSMGGSLATGGGFASTGGAAGSTGAGGTSGGLGSTGGAAGRAGGIGGTSSAGTQGCTWLADCISSNSCSDQACIDACAAQASDAAIAQYAALIDCVSANPQCTTTDCLALVCAGEIVACKDTIVAPIDGGEPALLDAGVPQTDAGPGPAPTDAGPATKHDAGGLAPADAQGPDAPVAIDASSPMDTGSGLGQGYTTSGSCDIVVNIPNLLDSHTCWDYTMTATTNHNDGTEHYVAYKTTDVAGTQSACTSQSYSGSQPGPWNSASLSASNLSHKKQACDLSGSSGATSTWTEGGACSTAGSLGHCTDAVTNAWDPATQVLSSSLIGVWSTP
jgi:collagen type VII alpha